MHEGHVSAQEPPKEEATVTMVGELELPQTEEGGSGKANTVCSDQTDDPLQGATAFALVESNTEAAELFWRRALKGRRKNLSDVVTFNKGVTRLRLFLFPSVALGPTEYSELGKFFDPEQPWHVLIRPIEACTAQPEGLIEEIAVYFADRLDEIQPGGPVVIGGWSAGVTPALEVARQLRARGRDVPLLIAIDMAPENTGVIEGRNSMSNRIKTNIYNSRQLGRNWTATTFDLVRTLIIHTVDKIFCRKPDHVDKLQKGSPGMSPEHRVQMHRFYSACFACSPPAPYDGKVLVIEASYDLHHRVRAKWESFANDIETVVIEGTHLSIVYWKAAAKLGEAINGRLGVLSFSCPDSLPLTGARDRV